MEQNLSNEAKAAKAAYQREYRRKHPDKIKMYAKTYWKKKAKSFDELPIEEKVCQLRKQGFSIREIGNQLDINRMKVQRIITENGL
jgi:hypothetical protein